ncbi:hypothetical protein [Lysinibacillus sp. 3P01SB]|uniref:hypothetical protein n=1 Tax=Lysinibacillus sp. 3P01SB TaxID=3132284 RepID=UPI0039A630CD
MLRPDLKESIQQVSKSNDPDLEEIYAALAKQAEGMDVSSPSSPGTYSAKEEITYEGMRKVLGGNGSGTPDGLALYAKSMGPSAKYVFDFFTEDIRTILDPEATAVEKAMAIGFTFFKPAKLLDKAGDVAGAARDAGKAVDRGRGTGELKHPVLDNPRVGSALKDDFYHNFNDIIDNYADDAQRFDLPNKKGHMDSLYQIEGSVVKYETKYVKVKNNASEMIQTKETKDGVFEWVVDPKTNTVTHRTFIPGGKVTGKINQWGK